MPTIELPFAMQEGKSSIAQNSQETLCNMYSEVEQSGRRKLIRRQRACLARVYAVSGEKRCIERFGAYHFCIIDGGFYRFDGTDLTLLASITSVTGRCTMVFDDTGNVLISDGATGYYWNGTAMVTVVHTTLIGPVAAQAGFGIFTVPNTAQFYVTDPNAMSTIDPLNFATAESNPDNLIRCIVDHNELWLFGTRTIEIWSNTGGVDFPYTPFVNSHMERGCAAAFSVAKEDNTIFWLGDDKIIYRADGYRPQRVSTHPIERLIADLPSGIAATADAFFYTIGGHKFYTLRFPDYLTLQYNVATGFWNVAKSWGYDDWRVIGSAGGATDYLMTDTGIVRLDDTINQDEGVICARSGISSPIFADNKRVIFRSFYLDCEVGRAPIGVEPQIMLRVARDGEIFGNERWRSLGTTGGYKRRAMWRNMGMGRKITVAFSFTDNASLSIVGSDGLIAVGSS